MVTPTPEDPQTPDARERDRGAGEEEQKPKRTLFPLDDPDPEQGIGRLLPDYFSSVVSHARASLQGAWSSDPMDPGEDLKQKALGALGVLASPFAPFVEAASKGIVDRDPHMSADYKRRISEYPVDDQSDPAVIDTVAHEAIDSHIARLLAAGADDAPYSPDERRAANVLAFALIMERAAEFGAPQVGVGAVKPVGRAIAAAADRIPGALERTIGEAAPAAGALRQSEPVPVRAEARGKPRGRKAGETPSAQAPVPEQAPLDLGLSENPAPLAALTDEQLRAFADVAEPGDKKAASIELARRKAAAERYMAQGSNVVDKQGRIIRRSTSQREAQDLADQMNREQPPRGLEEDPIRAKFAQGEDLTKLPERAAEDTRAAAEGRAQTTDVSTLDVVPGEAPRFTAPGAPRRKGTGGAGVNIGGTRRMRQVEGGYEVYDRDSGAVLGFGKTGGDAIAASRGEPPRTPALPSGGGEGGGKKPPTAAAAPGPAAKQAEEGLARVYEFLAKTQMPEVLKDVVKDRALGHAQDIQRQRRGVQPLAVTYAKARRLGIDTTVLEHGRPGAAVNAETQAAVFDALAQKTNELRLLRTKAAEVGEAAMSDMERAKLLLATAEVDTLTRSFMGFRAEAGRGLRVLQELYKMNLPGVHVKDVYTRALAAIGGRQNFDEMLRRLIELDTDPTLDQLTRDQKMLGLVQAAHSGVPTARKVEEFFINSILANPKTHGAYVMGQAAAHEAEVLSGAPAAVFEALRFGYGAAKSKVLRQPMPQRERTVTGAVTKLVVGQTATWNAMKKALYYLKNQQSDAAAGEFIETGRFRQQALESGAGPLTKAVRRAGVPIPEVPGAGDIIRLPTRGIETYTTFFRTLGHDQSLWQQAADTVASTGESPLSKEFWRKARDLVDDPPPAMKAKAEQMGRETALRQHGGVISTAVRQLRDLGQEQLGGWRPLFFIEPFTNITFAILSRGLEFSPAGYLRVATPLAKGAEKSDAFGRATVGTAVMAALWSKFDMGEITGPMPTDPQDRADFQAAGKKAEHIRVGDKWIPYGRLEPLATPLRTMVSVRDAMKREDLTNIQRMNVWHAAQLVASAFAHSLADSNFMLSIRYATEAMDSGHPEKLEQWAGRLASGFEYPSGLLRFVSGAQDTFERDPRTFWDQIAYITPGAREGLRVRTNRWGEPVQTPREQRGMGALNPFSAGPDPRSDKVEQELRTVMKAELTDAQGNPLPSAHIIAQGISETIASFGLTDEEGLALRDMAGQLAHASLADLIGGKTLYHKKPYGELTNAEKRAAINSAVNKAHEEARGHMADAILTHAETPAQRDRALVMRFATFRTWRERAEFLEAQQVLGHLGEGARSLVSSRLGANEPTLGEYLEAAPLIRQYLGTKPYLIGNPEEWAQLKTLRSQYDSLRASDPKAAQRFYYDPKNALLRRYASRAVVNPKRAELRKQHPVLSKFVEPDIVVIQPGANYEYDPNAQATAVGQ